MINDSLVDAGEGVDFIVWERIEWEVNIAGVL